MTFHSTKYEVIVVGAGHAGCEAALVAARMGCRVLLMAIDLDKVASTSSTLAAESAGIHEDESQDEDDDDDDDEAGVFADILDHEKQPACSRARK